MSMSHPSRPARSFTLPSVPALGLAVALAASTGVALPSSLTAQGAEMHAREAESQEQDVHRFLEDTRDMLQAIHGPIGRRVAELRPRLVARPHGPIPRVAYPDVPSVPLRVRPGQLLHHQAMHGGGSLGVLHGALDHPIGVAWFPHSMYAQPGGIYGQWGHALLLDAVYRYAAGQEAERNGSAPGR